MTKLYQILNFQFQHVITFDNLDEAKKHLLNLKESFSDKFYILELNVVCSL